MNANQMPLLSESPWRDYATDPVPHIRKLPIPEQIKRCAARFAWLHAKEVCPKSVEVDRKFREITWAEWFARKYGISLDEYLRETSKG